MRTATLVLVAYVLCVVLASVWRYMPGFVHDAIPAIGALTGPLVWRLYRRIDAAYARTARERDAALEGLAP
jgi:hypothetical protein